MEDTMLMKGTVVCALGIMGADTHAQGLRLRANVSVRQKIIPALMSKYTEIITH